MRVRLDPARTLLALVAAMMAAAASGGCYTILKHPRTDVTDAHPQTDFAHRDCYDCHRAGGSAQVYDPLDVPAFDYYGDELYGYYAYPWWHRNYWQSDDYGYGGGWRDSLGFQVPAADGSRRYLWGRGNSDLPPILPPIMGGSPGAFGGSGGAAGGGTTGPTDAPPPTTQDGRTLKPGQAAPPATTPPPPPAPDKKKDKKKDDKGNVWGRGGGQ